MYNLKNSCGAILYTYNEFGEFGIILGLEGDHWLPFKGCSNFNETFEQAAIREIREETCNLVHIDNIKLDHIFMSKRKTYHIGLCYAPYDIIYKFDRVKKLYDDYSYKEKDKIKFFPFKNLLENRDIHVLTKLSIEFYWDKLYYMYNSSKKRTFYRKQTISNNLARKYYELLNIQNKVYNKYSYRSCYQRIIEV